MFETIGCVTPASTTEFNLEISTVKITSAGDRFPSATNFSTNPFLRNCTLTLMPDCAVNASNNGFTNSGWRYEYTFTSLASVGVAKVSSADANIVEREKNISNPIIC